MYEEFEETEEEKFFHNSIREYFITFVIFVILYSVASCVISAYRRRFDREEYYSGDVEDATVYRTSLLLCTFALAISFGAVFLLPISIISNEILLRYPNSYYVQWLNSSLIHSLWNVIFLCSNLSLFVLMPFAYLFTESEGFSGSQKGVMARVYETMVVLFLMTILLFGMAWIISTVGDIYSNKKALFDVWNFYLPFLYSCISLLGVLMLLISSPAGFVHLFTITGELVTKPKLQRDLQNELNVTRMQENAALRKLNVTTFFSNHSAVTHNEHQNTNNNSVVLPTFGEVTGLRQRRCMRLSMNKNLCDVSNSTNEMDLEEEYKELSQKRIDLEKQTKFSLIRRHLCYPIVMLILFAITAVIILMIILNILELLTGWKSLPVAGKEAVLGVSSLSSLGFLGATLEIILILYVMIASVVGFYTLPLFRRLLPRRQDTTMTKIIGNCVLLIVLSSALPVLATTLGLTNFDLLGNFSRLEWLSQFYMILSYNILYAIVAGACLIRSFTKTLFREIVQRFRTVFAGAEVGKLRNRTHSSLNISGATVTPDSSFSIQLPTLTADNSSSLTIPEEPEKLNEKDKTIPDEDNIVTHPDDVQHSFTTEIKNDQFFSKDDSILQDVPGKNGDIFFRTTEKSSLISTSSLSESHSPLSSSPPIFALSPDDLLTPITSDEFLNRFKKYQEDDHLDDVQEKQIWNGQVRRIMKRESKFSKEDSNKENDDFFNKYDDEKNGDEKMSDVNSFSSSHKGYYNQNNSGSDMQNISKNSSNRLLNSSKSLEDLSISPTTLYDLKDIRAQLTIIRDSLIQVNKWGSTVK